MKATVKIFFAMFIFFGALSAKAQFYNAPLPMQIERDASGAISSIVSVNTIVEVTFIPNPFNTYFDVESAQYPLRRVQLIDALGRTVLDVQCNGSMTARIDTAHLPSGIYFAQAYLESDDVAVSKMIKR